jgi:hypothetical protein
MSDLRLFMNASCFDTAQEIADARNTRSKMHNELNKILIIPFIFGQFALQL